MPYNSTMYLEWKSKLSLILHTSGINQKGCGLSYTRPFTIKDQWINCKKLKWLDQTIKLDFVDESSNPAPIWTIKIFDRHRMWKYRAHSGDYPLASLGSPRQRSRHSGNNESKYALMDITRPVVIVFSWNLHPFYSIQEGLSIHQH